MSLTAEELIKLLDLQPHPSEGGFYKETYRSKDKVAKECLPSRYIAEKSYGTAIFYLLTPENYSSMHRLQTDEIFHFYLGDPVTMLNIYPDHIGHVITLGHDLAQNQKVQMLVPKGVWQGSFLCEGGKFALMGTTMAPGFDYEDYEAGNRNVLIEKYPEYKDLIIKLTPDE